MSIEVLDEDCLLKIFSYLTITELIQIEETSSLFKYITELAYKTFKNYTFKFRETPMNEIIMILERIGCNLNTLTFRGGYSLPPIDALNFLTALYSLCTNLHTLEIFYLMLDDTCRYVNVKKLKKLSLENCNINDKKLYEILGSQNNTLLTELSLQGNILLSGEALIQLTNLKFLNLKMCQITNDILISILKNNPNIKSLNLTYCSNLIFEKLLDQIAQLLPNLYELYLDNCTIRNYNPIAEFKQLKILSINYYLSKPMIILDDFLLLLIKKQIKLQVLNVNNHNLTILGETYLNQILEL